MGDSNSELPIIIVVSDDNIPIQSAMGPDPVNSDPVVYSGISGLDNILDEELSKIFAHLSVEERQQYRRVCHKWCDIIDIVFGMKIRVKNSTSDLITSCPWAVDVELNSMTQPFTDGISFAPSVRKLFFSNIVVTYNLVSFLRACNHITHLGFVNIVLDQPISDPWNALLQDQELIPLHKVETLEIRSFTFIDGVVEMMNFLNEKIFLPKLKDVILTVQNPPVMPYQILFQRNFTPATTHPLIRLLKKTRKTLRKLVVGRPNSPTILKFYPQNAEDEDSDSPPQLEHLEIHPYFREEWSPMLRDQIGIRVMKLGSCNVSRWGEIQESILLNSGALEEFTIGGLSFGQIWDCAVFQNCFLLRDLSIEISHSNKINLNMLPIQIKNLHIFGPIPRNEITSIANSLIQLEMLKFTHLGRIAEFNGAEEDKITLEMFKSLLQLPFLKSLCFTTCSSISIDWDLISLWCASVHGTPGFSYFEKFFQSHGEYFRNGVSVELSEDFKRDAFDWSTVPLVSISEMDSISSTRLQDSPDSNDEFIDDPRLL